MRRMIHCCVFVAVAAIVLSFVGGNVWAHCDTVSGPVAVDARQALGSESFEIIAIWVGEEQTAELRSAYQQSLPVYRMGGEARDLAEQHFIETAVRLHRQAEGFPYTGLQPAQPAPADIAAAERALETGNLAPVKQILISELEARVTALFQEVRSASSSKGESLAAGRDWADAYVEYVTYVHGIYGTIQAGPEHGIGE